MINPYGLGQSLSYQLNYRTFAWPNFNFFNMISEIDLSHFLVNPTLGPTLYCLCSGVFVLGCVWRVLSVSTLVEGMRCNLLFMVSTDSHLMS